MVTVEDLKRALSILGAPNRAKKFEVNLTIARDWTSLTEEAEVKGKFFWH